MRLAREKTSPQIAIADTHSAFPLKPHPLSEIRMTTSAPWYFKAASVFAFAGTALFFTAFAGVPDVEAASCRPGWWLNKDGTCTQRGKKHCNVQGVNWQCPSNTSKCRLTKFGEKLCIS
jgi:hypothetical protein